MPPLWLLSLFYTFYLGALGAAVPFMGAHMRALGLSGWELGLLFTLPPLGRLLVAPPLAALADRYQRAGSLIRAGTAVSALGAVALWAATGPVSAGLALALLFTGRTAPSPALDALVLDTLRAKGFGVERYGRVRLWGSVGFMAAAALAAWLEAPMALGALLASWVAVLAWTLPARAAPRPLPVWPALARLAHDPVLGPFLLCFGLQGMALSVYDAFFSVHVAALGLPVGVTAGAILLGVMAEILVMALAQRIFSRIAPADVLGLAVLVSVPRWLLTAWSADPWVLAGVQALHGLSFGGFWIAGVQLMSQRAPREVATAAQSLLVAAAYGIGALGGAMLAGALDEAAGTAAIFYGMAAVSCSAALVWIRFRRRLSAERTGEGTGAPAQVSAAVAPGRGRG